ncbi:MAG TPA: UPF0149 family protein [Gammaproteobacteria bacterium]|nr:UPF0149 family protein [Gammaproteobacteria bacterium]HIL18334.1 hypothetical protein [Gammaproteobacteria bacterium]
MMDPSKLQLDGVFYVGLQARLDLNGKGFSAAELHGTLTGLICAGWLETELDSCQALLGQDTIENAIENDLLTGLMGLIRQTLDAGNLEFRLLLPGDDEPLETRAQALADWCQGCVIGLHHGDRFKTAGLGDEIAQFLSDLEQIGIVEVGSDSPEEQERALFELEEYTRLGVQMVFEEYPSIGRVKPNGTGNTIGPVK